MNMKDLDLKKPEQRVNVSIVLPHKINKEVQLCAIATGELASKAKQSKVHHVMERDDLEKISGDKKEAKRLASLYDHFLAESSLMPQVGRILGPYLGPRGKMPALIPPNAPLEGIVENSLKTVRARVRDQPSLKCRVATEDMSDDERDS